MIFNISPSKDEFVKETYEKAMKELNEFFEINWVRHQPRIFIMPNRKIMDAIADKKTNNWVVGWGEKKGIYLLDRKNYEKESCHKYSKAEYIALIKHELVHSFIDGPFKFSCKPRWLDEGIAIYLSGQNKFKKPIKEFKTFLNFYDNAGKEIYTESGFAVELLVKKFGKQKIIQLIKQSAKAKNEKQFKQIFKKLYNFAPTYKEFNKLLKWQ